MDQYSLKSKECGQISPLQVLYEHFYSFYFWHLSTFYNNVSRSEGSLNSIDWPDSLKPVGIFHLIKPIYVQQNQDSFSDLSLSNDPLEENL